MKLTKIQDELKELGYPDDPSTSVYIESAGGIAKMLLGNYSVLTDKYYIASFQSTGVLFMTCSVTRNFTGASHFLDYKDISNVKISKTKFMNGRMLLNADELEIFDNDGGKATYICYNYILGEKFWKQNIQNIKKLVDSWPVPADRKQTTQPQQAPQSSNVTDQLRDMKSLLDDGVITQEDFNAKKKELLGL